MQMIRLLVGAVLTLLMPSAVQSQPSPIGSEFQVNETAYGDQGWRHGAEVAADAAGNFVVVWDGYGETGGRRFDSSGTPLGGDFHFGPAGPSFYYVDDPAVAASPGGGFVVVWADYSYSPNRISAQRYDSTGAPLGGEFQVTVGPNVWDSPKVAADAAGNFVVVWGLSPTDYGIWGQRFDSAGSPLGGEFRVDTSYGGGLNGLEEDLDGIEVAAAPDGSFMVVWEADAYYGEYQTQETLGRFFDSTGAAVGSDFRVSGTGTGYPWNKYPAIAADGAGNFVVAWTSFSSYGVFARRVDSTGSPVGTEFQVNTTGVYFGYPEVAADAAGRFVVVWKDYYDTIRGRQFSASGTPVGGEFVVSSVEAHPDDTLPPDVAFITEGEFVVAWAEYAGDGDGWGILGRRFSLALPPPACSAEPQTTCREQTKDRGAFRFRAPTDPRRKNLAWRWPTGEAAALEDFGDPLTDTDYALCVYDESTDPQPVIRALAPAGEMCGAFPCWRQLVGGQTIQYYDPAADPEGARRIRLRAGEEGKARVAFQGRGELLTLPQKALTPPVIVQLQASNGACFTATYDARIMKNVIGNFRARPGSPG